MPQLTSRLLVRLIDGVSAPARKAAQSMRSISDAAAAATTRSRAAMASSAAAVARGARGMQRHATAASAGVSLPAGMIARYGAQAAYEFAKIGNNVQAVTGMTDEQRASLEAHAKELNALFPYMNSQIMQAAFELGRAGLNFDQVLGTLQKTLQLGLAGDIELGQAADIATNVMMALGLKMGTTEEAAASLTMVVDRLTYAANKSNTDVRLMGETMKYVAPMARAAGMSIDDVSAAAMIMANNGIKGSEAGVAMRSALVRMVKPTKPMLAALARLNLNLGDFVKKSRDVRASDVVNSLAVDGIDASKSTKQIDRILKNRRLQKKPAEMIKALTNAIAKGVDGAADREKIAEAISLALTSAGSQVDLKGFMQAMKDRGATLGDIANVFDARQGARLITLLFGDLAAASDDVGKSAEGAAKRMAEMRMKGIVGTVAALKAGWENLFIIIGESGVMDTVSDAMKRMTRAIEGLSKSNPALLKFAAYALMIAAVMGPLGLVISGFGSVLGLFASAAAVATGALGVLASGGLLALLGPGRALLAIGGPILAFLRSLAVGIAASAAISGVSGVFAGFASSLAAMGMAALRLLNPMTLIRGAIMALRFALFAFPGVALFAALAMAGVWVYNNWEKVKAFFAGFGAGLMDGLAPVMPAIQPLIDGVSWLYDKISSLTGEVSSNASSWASWGTTIGTTVGSAIATVIEKLASLVGWIGRAYDGAVSIGNAVKGWFTGGGGRSSPGGASSPPARSRGGRVSRGQSYVVGERRPEVFTPGQSGYVSSRVPEGGGGSITLNQTINVTSSAADAVSVAREVKRQIASDIRDIFRGVQGDVGLGYS